MSFLNSLNARNDIETMRNDLISLQFSGHKVNENDNDNDKYCYCKKDCYGNMILCEKCCGWFHYDCARIIEGKEPNQFICNNCIINNKRKNKRKIKDKI